MLSKIEPFQNRKDKRKWEEFIKQFLEAASYSGLSPAVAAIVLGAHLDGESLIHYDLCLQSANGSLKNLVLLLAGRLTSFPDIVGAVSSTDPNLKTAREKLQNARKENNENAEDYVKSFIKDYEEENPKKTFWQLLKRYSGKNKRQLVMASSESDEDENQPVLCAAVQYQLNLSTKAPRSLCRGLGCCKNKKLYGLFAIFGHSLIKITVKACALNADSNMDETETPAPTTPTAPTDDEEINFSTAITNFDKAAVEFTDEFDDDDAFIKDISTSETLYPDLLNPPQLPEKEGLPIPETVLQKTLKVINIIQRLIHYKSWTDHESKLIFDYTRVFFQAQTVQNLAKSFYETDFYCSFLRANIASIRDVPHAVVIAHCNGHCLKPQLKKMLEEIIRRHQEETWGNEDCGAPNTLVFSNTCRMYWMAQPKESLLVPALLSTNFFRFLKWRIAEFQNSSLSNIAAYCRKTDILTTIREERETVGQWHKMLDFPFEKQLGQ